MNQAIENANLQIPEPEICIWIDKYDDVFSDFDSRPFADRALSDDFLRELRKMISDKSGNETVLKFHILDDQRNSESEAIISHNLRTHFRHIADVLTGDRKQTLHKGYMLLGFGFLLILFLFFLTTIVSKAAYLNGINLMLEPVGWFMTWTGLDYVFQISRKSQSALQFNSKMANAQIAFSSFEPIQISDTEELARPKTVIPMDNNNLRVA